MSLLRISSAKVIFCLSSSMPAGRRGIYTTPFTYPYKKKSHGGGACPVAAVVFLQKTVFITSAPDPSFLQVLIDRSKYYLLPLDIEPYLFLYGLLKFGVSSTRIAKIICLGNYIKFWGTHCWETHIFLKSDAFSYYVIKYQLCHYTTNTCYSAANWCRCWQLH